MLLVRLVIEILEERHGRNDPWRRESGPETTIEDIPLEGTRDSVDEKICRVAIDGIVICVRVRVDELEYVADDVMIARVLNVAQKAAHVRRR